MRVLFVGPFPWPSHQGSQTYMASQANALVGRGHDVHALVYGAGAHSKPAFVLHRARRIPGGDFAHGGMHASRPLHDLAMARALRRLVRRLRPDILHVHNIEGPLIAAAARTHTPVVYDLHTRMAEELADHLPRPLRRLGPPIGRRFDHLALRLCDAGCAISSRALQVFERAEVPATLVGPCVDPSELVARPDAAERFSPVDVIYTGNLDGYQNLPALYDAVERHGLSLRIVTGSSQRVPDGIDVVRSTDFQDALDALSTARLAVIPRVACAGFPIKLLNQLGMGVPTVMFHSAAVELPGVIPTHDLGQAITHALRDDVRGTQGPSARRHILQHWTPNAQAIKLERLYASVTRMGATASRPPLRGWARSASPPPRD